MGQDITEFDGGACPCGKGQLVVVKAEPDHAWPSSSVSWHGDIRCEDCTKQLALIEQGGAFVLVERSAMGDRQQHAQQLDAEERAVMDSDQAKQLLERFAVALDAMPSRAAKHRAMTKVQAFTGGDKSFKNELERSRSTENLVNRNVRPSNLAAVAEFLGENLGNLQHRLDALEELRRRVRAPLPIQGAPVFDLPALPWYRG